MNTLTVLIVVSTVVNLVCARAAEYSFSKDDPFVIVSVKRAEEIILAIKKRESIELIFGKGDEEKRGFVTYSFREIPNVRPAGFAGVIFVEYDGAGNVVKCKVGESWRQDPNLIYPKADK